MKLTKYLLIACSALIMAACSNDDDWNSASDVTVQMAKAELKTRENKKLFNVPLEVVGKANGPIRVTVEMAPMTENPANEDKHYYVTSKTVVIPDNEANVSIEFAPVNDKEINEDRVFKVSIVKVEGATIGEQNSTEVIIRDDDSLPYEAIQGSWNCTYIDIFRGTNESFEMTITGVEDDEDILYGRALYFSGWGGAANLTAEVEYNYIEESGEVELEFVYGQNLGQLDFDGIGKCDVDLYGCDGNSFFKSGSCVATVDPKLQTITFEYQDGFFLAVISNGEYLGGWDGFVGFAMERKE